MSKCFNLCGEYRFSLVCIPTLEHGNEQTRTQLKNGIFNLQPVTRNSQRATQTPLFQMTQGSSVERVMESASSCAGIPRGRAVFLRPCPMGNPVIRGIFRSDAAVFSRSSTADGSPHSINSPPIRPAIPFNWPANERWVSIRSMRYNGSPLSSINRIHPARDGRKDVPTT